MHAIYADPEVMRYVGHGPHRTMSETTAALRAYGDMLARRGFSFLAVDELATGRVIGDAGLHPLGGTGPEIELGYTLARDAWGQGYATELGRALVAPRADRRSASRASSRRSSRRNPASRHVLEKLGMREREVRTAYGRPHLLYAALRRRAEPRARRGSPRRP